MIFKLNFLEEASKELGILKKSENKAYKKAIILLEELKEHPRTGTGKPKALKHDKKGLWSRKISDKHRLIYKIEDDKVIVVVISAFGHYNDK
jgi:toxin YoeB